MEQPLYFRIEKPYTKTDHSRLRIWWGLERETWPWLILVLLCLTAFFLTFTEIDAPNWRFDFLAFEPLDAESYRYRSVALLALGIGVAPGYYGIKWLINMLLQKTLVVHSKGITEKRLGKDVRQIPLAEIREFSIDSRERIHRTQHGTELLRYYIVYLDYSPGPLAEGLGTRYTINVANERTLRILESIREQWVRAGCQEI